MTEDTNGSVLLYLWIINSIKQWNDKTQDRQEWNKPRRVRAGYVGSLGAVHSMRAIVVLMKPHRHRWVDTETSHCCMKISRCPTSQSRHWPEMGWNNCSVSCNHTRQPRCTASSMCSIAKLAYDQSDVIDRRHLVHVSRPLCWQWDTSVDGWSLVGWSPSGGGEASSGGTL